MLEKCLMDRDMVPSKEFDWNIVKSEEFKENLTNRQKLLLGENIKIIHGLQRRKQRDNINNISKESINHN